MSLHDWIVMALLVITTLMSVGRWIEAREQKEVRADEGAKATRADLAEFEKRHSEEHEKIWREIERNRDHWHKELVPKLQGIIERVAVAEGAERAHGEDLRRLQTIIDRRRGGRD